MEIIFLGTKGEIEESSKKHKYHSSALLTDRKFKLLVDYGNVQKYSLEKIKPDAILVTHAHPDHYAWTLRNVKTNIPVYLTKETFRYGRFKPGNPVIIKPYKKFKIGIFSILPYRVIHSVRCPAVGFRISLNKKILIYNPDLVDIIKKDRIMKNADYYIGDGSCIKANLVRNKNGKIFGHSRISTQMKWCREYGIKNIFFTHLGKETISKEKKFKKEHPEIIMAFDGMKIKI